MKVTGGIEWILAGTTSFEETVRFFRDVMGLPVRQEGVPTIDTQFTRYAQLEMPNGVVLEIVEPREALREEYRAPVLSITVDDVAAARRQMEAQGIGFTTPLFETGEGWGWTYFRAPDGTLYQLQGPSGPAA